MAFCHVVGGDEMEYIEQFLRTVQEYVKLIGFFDVLDMAIVAFVVYHIFRFVRRSRSGQVVKAILLIVLALGIANLLQLQVVSFVLNNAVELGFIALVIIFQPEIRRFLEQMGSAPNLGHYEAVYFANTPAYFYGMSNAEALEELYLTEM